MGDIFCKELPRASFLWFARFVDCIATKISEVRTLDKYVSFWRSISALLGRGIYVCISWNPLGPTMKNLPAHFSLKISNGRFKMPFPVQDWTDSRLSYSFHKLLPNLWNIYLRPQCTFGTKDSITHFVKSNWMPRRFKKKVEKSELEVCKAFHLSICQDVFLAALWCQTFHLPWGAGLHWWCT